MAKFTLHTQLDSDELADSLTAATDDELFAFIVALDDRVNDLAFTRRLAEHFAKVVRDEEGAA